MCPVLVVPIIYWQNIDICILSIFVLVLNVYIAFSLGGEEFGSSDNDTDSEEEVDK